MDGTITSTKHIPLHLAEHGTINVSRKEISKLTGRRVFACHMDGGMGLLGVLVGSLGYFNVEPSRAKKSEPPCNKTMTIDTAIHPIGKPRQSLDTPPPPLLNQSPTTPPPQHTPGKVFLERNEVNLHSDILDTPEWFWEADLWEPRWVRLPTCALYLYIYGPVGATVGRILRILIYPCLRVQFGGSTHLAAGLSPPSPQLPKSPTPLFLPPNSYGAFCKYLDLPNRINILNKRLDILRELLNVLETQLDNSHSTKLELIVIALIIVEVVLQVLEIALNDLFHVGGGGAFI